VAGIVLALVLLPAHKPVGQPASVPHPGAGPVTVS